MEDLRIDTRRFRRDFERLSAIGATADGGVHRPALGENHLQARRWFRELIQSDALELVRDGAGNHSARLACTDPDARTLLLGSHLDSVPHGGRFDGALGVLAAYEVLRTVRDAELRTRVHLEAVDFTDEEGTLVCLMGSRALTGALRREELEQPRGGVEALQAGLGRAGLTIDGVLGARRDPRGLAGFVELHIEQGPRLTASGAAIGIVGSIVGIGSVDVRFVGRADHAGTTPMQDRRDAGLGAAELITAAHRRIVREFPECVLNFGRVELVPGAYNIVPRQADLGLEFRAPDEARLTALETALVELGRETARRHELGLEIERRVAIPPVPCAPEVREAFTAACASLGLPHLSLNSGAGHDTAALAAVCPSGMIFIPSTGGSHSASEFAEWQACVDGANTLLLAALRLAARAEG